MFRYYSWLPVELEPEYEEGFTCDKCGNDFLTAPFFHQDESGTDFCVRCGENEGITPFNGLISALLFNNTGEVLRDEKTGCFVVFAYQVHQDRFGLHFSDGSNVGVQAGPSYNVVSVDYQHPSLPTSDGEGLQRKALDSRAWQERFPWLSGGLFSTVFTLVVQLHDSLPNDTLPAGDNVFVARYEHTSAFFSLELGGGWQQVFDSESGTEVVAKNGRVVTLFRPAGSDARAWEKADAQLLYGEMLAVLKDKPPGPT